MARSLAERLQAHEQQKAKLAEQEAKLKVAERKARTRRMIEAGGLVEKTGLLDLDANALYGALLSLREAAGSKKQVEQWAALGGRAFSREANARGEGASRSCSLSLPPFRCQSPSRFAPRASGSTRCSATGKDWPVSRTQSRSPAQTPAPSARWPQPRPSWTPPRSDLVS